MICFLGSVHIIILPKFHFVVVFLRVLADDALEVLPLILLWFGLIVHRLHKLVFVAVLDFDQVYRSEVGNSCATARPLHLLLFANGFDLGLLILLGAEVPFGD